MIREKLHRYQIPIRMYPSEHKILRRLAFERQTSISILVKLAIGLWLPGEKGLLPSPPRRRIRVETKGRANGKRKVD